MDFEEEFQNIVNHYRDGEESQEFSGAEILETLQSLQSACWYISDILMQQQKEGSIELTDVAIILLRGVKSEAELLIEELEGTFDDDDEEEDDFEDEYDDDD